jgi:hypothetical protein
LPRFAAWKSRSIGETLVTGAYVVYGECGGLFASLFGQLIEARRVLAPRAAGLTTL